MAVFQLLLSWTSQAFIFLFFLTFIAFLGCCLYLKYIHMKYDHIPGPPRDSFFFGHTPTILRMMKNGEVAHDKFLEWAEIYGSVFRLNFLHYVSIAVSCPEATKEILMSPKYTKDKFFCKKLFSLFGQRFLGNGLVTAHNHEKWYKQRRIMNPAFSSLYLRGLMGTFNERAENLMSKLADIADSKTETSMLHLFSCVTLDVIAKVAFGVDLDLLKTSTPFPKAIETCLKGLLYNVRDSFFQFNPKNRPFIKEVREACHLLRTTGAQWIHERKTAMENGDDVPKDILTQIIKSAGQEDSMTKEDEEIMLDNFVTFFIAGKSLLCLCYDDLGQLIYLSQVLKETLRIYPTVPGVTRELPEDMVISGIHIPGGCVCAFSSYATGRMEKFFKDPLTFDPDRFHPDAPKPYYCYYPFSLGPRSCLGQNFAQMEAKVVMAKLLQRFDFTLVPGQTFDILDTGTLRPKSGVVCTVSHRNDKK
uniref:cholesterol 24-hydroxylase-like n=1 Tax=Monopterus albus TaxID=43700 RepID=UPI0009B3B314|nr:cholesterol 24-hydroxylase-like [Monopterus albus]